MIVKNIKIDFRHNKLFICDLNNKYIEYSEDRITINGKLGKLLSDIYSKKLIVRYYAGKGKFWYIYFYIRNKHLNWFDFYKIKFGFKRKFIKLYLYLFKRIKNKNNYYLLNISSMWNYNYDLIYIKLYKSSYRLLNCKLSNSMSMYKAYAMSNYCYLVNKYDVFMPVTYNYLKKNKFNYKKLKYKNKFYNTQFNKYDMLSNLMVNFYHRHIEYIYNDELKNKLFNKYKKIVLNDGIELINTIYDLKYKAGLHYGLNNIFFLNKNSGIYKMLTWDYKELNNDFNEIIKQYKKCYKHVLKG